MKAHSKKDYHRVLHLEHQKKKYSYPWVYGSRYNFNLIKALKDEKSFLAFWKEVTTKIDQMKEDQSIDQEETNLLMDWASCVKRVFTDVEVAKEEDGEEAPDP